MTVASAASDRQARRPPGLAFSVFLAGQTTSLLGDGLATLAIPLLVLQVTRSPLAAALSAAPRTMGYLLVGLPAGAVVDRMSPKAVMLAMDLIRLTVFLLLAALIAADAITVWMILALAFAAASAGALFETALTVAVRDLVQPSQLVRTNSFLESANQGSQIVGPGIVGVLAATVGLNMALLVNASTFAISFVTVFCALGRGRDPAATASSLPSALRSMRRDMRDGFRALRSMRVIYIVTVMQAIINLFFAANSLLVFYAKEGLHLSDPAVSTVVVAGGIGGILGAIAAARLAVPDRQIWLIIAGVACTGLALLAMSLARSLPTLSALNLFMCASAIFSAVIIRALRQRLVPREVLGRITATARATALAASPVGIMIAGALTGLDHGDPRPVFLGGGLLTVATTVVAWFAGLRSYSGMAGSAAAADAGRSR
jgi:predicted MFS family arabinose efflux permease